MARSLTSTQLQAIFAASTDQVWLTLVTLTHPDFTVVRLVNNTVEITSRGNNYQAFPMAVRLPDDNQERGPKAQLVIANVTRDLIDEVRGINGRTKIKATLEVIMASEPDTVVASYPDFEFRNISYDDMTLQGDLTLEDFLSEPYPGDTFNPAQFPALF